MLAILVDGVSPAVPGFHADERFGVLLPEHAVAEHGFIKGDRDFVTVAGIRQDHRALDAGQQADGLGRAVLFG